MTRVRTAKDQKSPELETTNQDASNGQESRGKVSKADAARAALREGFGGPQEAVAYIKKTFGISMSPQHFSAVKSQETKKDETLKGKSEHKPKSQAVEGYLAPPPKMVPTGEGDLIDILEKMKPLIAQYGADKVKRLVDLLG